MELLLCSDDGNRCLLVHEQALEIIQKQALKYFPFETGGILLGYYDSTRRTANVVFASPPPPDSKHGRTQFFRGIKGVSNLIAWGRGQTPSVHYVGEWHTHPKAKPLPSTSDIKQMDDFAARRMYDALTPILLVVGGTPYKKLLYQASVHQLGKAPLYLHPF